MFITTKLFCCTIRVKEGCYSFYSFFFWSIFVIVFYLKVMNEDGHTSSIRDKILTINVKPGWRAGTRITFPKEGDQGPNNISGSLISFFLFSTRSVLIIVLCHTLLSERLLPSSAKLKRKYIEHLLSLSTHI